MKEGGHHRACTDVMKRAGQKRGRMGRAKEIKAENRSVKVTEVFEVHPHLVESYNC